MYFVLTREEEDFKESFGGAWGYYWDLETAIDAVHRNVTDMHETIYPYAIIEQLDHGLFPVPKERHWFGWEEEKDGFYEIEKPECANVVPENFSMALGATGKPNSPYTETLPDDVDDECPNYFIMAMSSDDTDGERIRRCGFFKNRETAIKAVRENWGNIHNDKYDVVYIECITPYVIAWSLEHIWFKWDNEKGEYCESIAPEYIDWPEPPFYPLSFL
jgi:hypothetical protein